MPTKTRIFKLNPDISKPKFFGRRKGRTIRKAKSFLLDNFLPQILIKPTQHILLSDLFETPKKRYCLEIGFGDGEHLAGIAKAQPDAGFIGVEVYKNGVANLLTLLTGVKEGDDVENAEKISIRADREDNIRVFDDDVRLLFNALPDASFDKVFLLFPDPWPKKRHTERRFVNPDNLKELARVLKKGGLFRVATDHPVYKRHVLRVMHACPDFIWTAKCGNDWKHEPQDWVRTKYQEKAIREGRRPVFFNYKRVR
jgi:tRNA (guanine-N7-)-methyltransferase